jgi:membrane associated rhomboid family serine protease
MARGQGFSGGYGSGGQVSIRLFPPLTPVIKAVAITLAALYVLELLWVHWVGPEILGPDAGFGLMLHLPLTPVEFFGGFVWQPLTYLLLHDPYNPSHVLLNLAMLWMFGAEVESLRGTRRFLLLLLLCGLSGALGVVILGLVGLGWASPAIGFSGAVYGVMAAYGLLFPDRTLWPLPIRSRHLIYVVLGLTLLSFLIPGSNQSVGAHLGGLAGGALLVGGPRWWRRRGRGGRGGSGGGRVVRLEDELARLRRPAPGRDQFN